MNYQTGSFKLQVLFPRWENKIDLFVRMDMFSSRVFEGDDGFIQVDKPQFTTIKVFIGRFQGHEYDLATSAFVYTPQS
jgi:hypothetical protein